MRSQEADEEVEWDLPKYLEELTKINHIYKGYYYRDLEELPLTWAALSESVDAYIEWRKDNQRAYISSSLQDQIDKQLRESIAVKSSSNIEEVLINSLLERVGNKFEFSDDIYEYHPHKKHNREKRKDLFKKLPDYMQSSMEASIPSKGANPSYNNIITFISKVHTKCSDNFKSSMKRIKMHKEVLDNISEIRNKISHGSDYGVLSNMELYYIVWYSYEISMLIRHILRDENQDYMNYHPTDENNHKLYLQNIRELN